MRARRASFDVALFRIEFTPRIGIPLLKVWYGRQQQVKDKTVTAFFRVFVFLVAAVLLRTTFAIACAVSVLHRVTLMANKYRIDDQQVLSRPALVGEKLSA